MPTTYTVTDNQHTENITVHNQQNDLLEALDKVFVLVLLDLPAAIETIDNVILIQRLQHTSWITGTALAWFRSYLGHMYQTVVVGGERSEPHILQYGIR